MALSLSLRAIWLPAFDSGSCTYCGSYSPLPALLRTVKPAFLASEMESGFSFIGEVNVEMTLRTGFWQTGQWVNGAALSGRRNVNWPPHTVHSPSDSSYS